MGFSTLSSLSIECVLLSLTSVWGESRLTAMSTTAILSSLVSANERDLKLEWLFNPRAAVAVVLHNDKLRYEFV